MSDYIEKRDKLYNDKCAIENRIYVRKLVLKFKQVYYKVFFTERRTIIDECINLINNNYENIQHELLNVNSVKTHDKLKTELSNCIKLKNHFQQTLIDTNATNWWNTLPHLAFEDEFLVSILKLWTDDLNIDINDSSSIGNSSTLSSNVL